MKVSCRWLVCFAERSWGTEGLGEGMILHFPNLCPTNTLSVLPLAHGCRCLAVFTSSSSTWSWLGVANPSFKGQMVHKMKSSNNHWQPHWQSPQASPRWPEMKGDLSWLLRLLIICQSSLNSAECFYLYVRGHVTNSLLSCRVLWSSHGLGRLLIPSRCRDGLDLCFIFMLTSHWCQQWIHSSSLWVGKQ